MRRTLLEVIPPLSEVWPSYFDKSTGTGDWIHPCNSRFDVSCFSLEALREFMLSHPSWDKRNAIRETDLDPSKRLDLHAAQAEAMKQLKVNWDNVRDKEDREEGGESLKFSMVGVSQWHAWHFTCRDHKKTVYKAACANPTAG